jgi:hypothetical protein
MAEGKYTVFAGTRARSASQHAPGSPSDLAPGGTGAQTDTSAAPWPPSPSDSAEGPPRARPAFFPPGAVARAGGMAIPGRPRTMSRRQELDELERMWDAEDALQGFTADQASAWPPRPHGADTDEQAERARREEAAYQAVRAALMTKASAPPRYGPPDPRPEPPHPDTIPRPRDTVPGPTAVR